MGKITEVEKQTARQTRLQRMLADSDVKRWHDNLARGSILTAENRVRRLDTFCEQHDLTPGSLVEMAQHDLREASDLLEDHVTAMEYNGYAPGYTEDYVKTVKSWLRHFDINVTRRIKIANTHMTPTLEGERVPNREELIEIYSRAPSRERAMISLMAKSGLRPEVIGNHDGTDGLRIKDMPDIVIHEGRARCVRAPARIVVRREISKARHKYFTFCTTTGVGYILAHINDRLARGEQIHEDSAVIGPDSVYKTYRGANANKEFLPTRRVSLCIRKVFRPRFAWRPYVLRAYFDTQLLIAESKGKIAGDFRSFFMGHHGNIEARYTTNKGILPESLVGEMREAFVRSEEHLDLETDREDPIIQQKEEAQQVIDSATPEQLGAMLKVFKQMGAGKMCQANA